ncbi:MAG: hypothetical protein CMM59_18195 [Rhodospirillaceae bacterium]|nr:hypothetical protein [Rhodospirillaceae bacterium]
MIRLRQFVISAAVLSVLGGCGPPPFVTSTPKQNSGDDRQVVSVCYNANSTTREEIYKVAAKECDAEGASLEFFHHDKLLNECPILAKTRVSFICIPPQK